MEIYLVGGAVRDKLLNLPIKDRDWVVTGATSQMMLDQGYLQVGKDFPVFLHPESKEEYALARTERKVDKGYHGFECNANPEVTLEQDLQRRDLTINAMAEDSNGQIIDPYNGRDDLKQGVLRHVSQAFSEDPVRILRIARFAARFAERNFYVAHSTNKLMKAMVNAGEVDALVPERCWAETHKALSEISPLRYLQVLRGSTALAVIFPEIDSLYPQSTRTSAHSKQAQPPIFKIFSKTCQSDNAHYQHPKFRFALLMMGIYFNNTDIKDISILCKRLRVPSDYEYLAITAANMHQAILIQETLTAVNIFSIFEKSDALRKPERFAMALKICLLFPDIEKHLTVLLKLPKLLDQCIAIKANNLEIKGLQGKEIGVIIRKARLKSLRDNM
ncbi:CCA tRNA nucleotidyltransferase [hydrothermal vent metagenome]|uniref:CCA tRNA nucleotidyltransferase n=1 Tax=hydrothermal vent metagenome TaxID=652676 RepID=A0A3B0YH55_9ZZZZ